MKIRFYNAQILTMENDDSIIKGELWVNGNAIKYIGETPEVIPKFDKEIDVENNLLMPGFKNAHSHSAMTFLRSYADDLPLLDWLNKQIFPMEAKLKEEHIYYFSILAIMEYLTSGITANFDMYLYPSEIARASIDTGFRTVLSGCLNNFYSSVDEIEQNYLHYNSVNELISHRLGFHAEYTMKDELLEGIGNLAQKYKAPVYMHNSESKREVLECLERTGMTPTERTNKFGIYNYGGGGFHCVHLSENDIAIFKKNNLSVISNPGSNCKLASGIAPLLKYENAGLTIALGTDGPASNNCLDMFREMFLATAMQKILTNDASAMDSLKVLKMATTNGAIVMGLDKCTCLKEGYLADLIMIDLNQPNMQPINNIAKNIVYSGSKTNVKMTMINGKILYHDGKFNINHNPHDIYAKVNELTLSIKNS